MDEMTTRSQRCNQLKKSLLKKTVCSFISILFCPTPTLPIYYIYIYRERVRDITIYYQIVFTTTELLPQLNVQYAYVTKCMSVLLHTSPTEFISVSSYTNSRNQNHRIFPIKQWMTGSYPRRNSLWKRSLVKDTLLMFTMENGKAWSMWPSRSSKTTVGFGRKETSEG